MRTFTTGEVARQLGRPVWHIHQIYLRGLVEEPPRTGGKRVIREADIPAIQAALNNRTKFSGKPRSKGIAQAS